mmetsp:Transcript_16795/g.35510  ORF Transcript_16795/g.35510 Transcript_16795/m.35510 type:complete len:266 (-) Transcript_16795:533-1330(-)
MCWRDVAYGSDAVLEYLHVMITILFRFVVVHSSWLIKRWLCEYTFMTTRSCIILAAFTFSSIIQYRSNIILFQSINHWLHICTILPSTKMAKERMLHQCIGNGASQHLGRNIQQSLGMFDQKWKTTRLEYGDGAEDFRRCFRSVRRDRVREIYFRLRRSECSAVMRMLYCLRCRSQSGKCSRSGIVARIVRCGCRPRNDKIRFRTTCFIVRKVGRCKCTSHENPWDIGILPRCNSGSTALYNYRRHHRCGAFDILVMSGTKSRTG